MQFLTKQDFLTVISEEDLDYISEESEAQLTTMESVAMSEMIGYLNKRYLESAIFDANSKNALVVMYLCDLVIYHLHSKISPDNIPELRVKRYDSAISALEKIADGFTTINLPPKKEEEKHLLRYGSSAPKQNHYY